jgi:hypothetical protein
MILPHTELRSINAQVGAGVIATHFIPCGTITWARDELDQVLSPARVATMPALFHDMLEKYTYRDDAGNFILCWDLARFMNHSCAPSCLGTGYGFEIAVRDIQPGEELTDDYAALYLQSHESFNCLCGTPHCRQRITQEDAPKQAAVWRVLLRQAFRHIGEVDQPLWPLIRPEDLARAARDLAPEVQPVYRNGKAPERNGAAVYGPDCITKSH